MSESGTNVLLLFKFHKNLVITVIFNDPDLLSCTYSFLCSNLSFKTSYTLSYPYSRQLIWTQLTTILYTFTTVKIVKFNIVGRVIDHLIVYILSHIIFYKLPIGVNKIK